MEAKPSLCNYLDPRLAITFLDTCAFDPKYYPEHESAELIRHLGKQDKVILVLSHSNAREIEHPNTPKDVKEEALLMISTEPTKLNPVESRRMAGIHDMLTGPGKPSKYAADAAHVFESGKYGGYFITTDARILGKRVGLKELSQANIVKPSEWIQIYEYFTGGECS